LGQGFIEIFVLALVAFIVLFRLYTTLGRRTGAERPPRPQPAEGELPRESMAAPLIAMPIPAGPAAEGLVQIARADPNFEPIHFTAGAKGAYELIVNAFAKGDRDTLKPLLTPRVFDAYAAAIAEREKTDAVGPELVRLKSGEIDEASLEGDIARVAVKFEAELAEGVHGVRDARERWTFERNVRSADPNWRLARVAQA
jgi:predicted lipid-binding transport protein (Tim44 family)